MNRTQWLNSILDISVTPYISSVLPEGVVSTSYIVIENEAPTGVDTNGYVDTSVVKGFNTKITYISGTLKVYLNGIALEIIETGDMSFTVLESKAGYMTISYVPKDLVNLHGNIDTYNDLYYTTNPVLKYTDITSNVINQMRYAVNQIQKLKGLQQTRWCGGFYSDEFSLAEYDDTNKIYRSNLRQFITEITPQLIYELLDAVPDTASKLGIQIIGTYDTNKVYSKLGIEYGSIEIIRKHINTMEAAIEI